MCQQNQDTNFFFFCFEFAWDNKETEARSINFVWKPVEKEPGVLVARE